MHANHQNNQQGVVLLFSLIILGVMSAIAFGISSLVYREVNVARSFDDSLQSYYAAESGIERALDIVAEHRKQHDTLANTLAAVVDYAPKASPVTLPESDSTYTIDSTKTTSTTTQLHIPLRDFFQVDLYNPDASVTSFMNAESARLLWNVADSCTAGSRMEMTFQEFTSSSFGLTDDSVYKQVYTCGIETAPVGTDCQATSNWPAKNTNYVIQIHSLDCPSVDATLSFYDADDAGGTVVEIPSVITIASIGSGNLSQREIIARTKWIPGASGLSAYVLFSLESVVK